MKVIAGLAVVGATATLAYFGSQNVTSGQNFIATPMGEFEISFMTFLAKHNKSYGTKEEYEYRLSEYSKNMQLINDHNKGDHTYKLAENKFADQSDAEYKKMLGLKGSKSS